MVDIQSSDSDTIMSDTEMNSDAPPDEGKFYLPFSPFVMEVSSSQLIHIVGTHSPDPGISPLDSEMNLIPFRDGGKFYSLPLTFAVEL